MVLLRGLNEITFAEQVPNGHQFVSMQQPPPPPCPGSRDWEPIPVPGLHTLRI